jgi:hypothetical protein
MSRLTIFLARLIGLFLLIVPLAVYAQGQSFGATMTALVNDRPLLLVLGLIALAAGIAIVLAHNIWTGGALPIVVTLLGWLIIFRGLFLLFLPPQTLASILVAIRFDELSGVYLAIPLALGLYLTYSGFANPLPPVQSGVARA